MWEVHLRSVVVCTLVVLLLVGCIEEETRTLKRRVQMGQMRVPSITLPSGQGQFDFQYVVNSQAHDILRRTKVFSTSTIDPAKIYDPAGLEVWDASQFNSCAEPSEIVKMSSGAGSISETAACMIDQPQGIISGDLNNFQLMASGGATLSMLDVAVMQQASFDFKSYELSMSLRVTDPHIRGHNIAATAAESYSNDIGVTATINFGGLSAGPKIYYNSPLRKVVDEVMTSAIRDLQSQWDKASPWYATVIRACDRMIFVNGGSKTDAGLMVGDTVRIHNVLYRWSGQACQSTLLGSAITERALGYAKIVSVGDTMSVAQLIENDENYPLIANRTIKPGSRIYIEKFAPAR